jgi:glycosyltransferase involved in cell wall biosynthesis
MRVLYHHRTQAEDAQGVHISEIVRAFRELGHEVKMASLADDETAKTTDPSSRRSAGLWKRLAGLRSDRLYILLTLAYNLYGFLRLRREIRSRRPDMIYERYSLNTVCGIWASRYFDIPIVIECNVPFYYELNEFGRLHFKRLVRFTERWICSNSSATLVVTQAIKDYLVAEGVPAARITVMPNGVDGKKMNPGISGAAVRSKHGLDSALVVGFVGWFREWHGLDRLLETLREGRLAQRGVKILLVGDGPANAGLKRYARRHGLQDSVVFAGPVPHAQVGPYIAAMDITVLPKANEYACPMKIIEYMALGKCVVAPDQPNVREILEHGVNGYLFPPDDPERLRSTLVEAIEDETSRERIARGAAETVRERRYFWTANAERTLGLVFGETGSGSVESADRLTARDLG